MPFFQNHPAKGNPVNTNHPKIGAYRKESLCTTPKIGFLYEYSNTDPVAAMKKAAWAEREREQSATPVVRLVWIGGSAGAMQLVNVYTHVSAILSV
mgnify:CR=1 FL=1